MDGLTTNLVIIAIATWLISFLLAKRYLSMPAALFVSFIKSSIPVVYFSWFFTGKWTFFDDLDYIKSAIYMLDAGYNPVSALFSSDGVIALESLTGGQHILYDWWNTLAMYTFGVHYYAPVFLNVILTFIAAMFLNKTLHVMEFGKQYRTWFLLFFLLHIDVVVWSSFVNLKDILVMTLTVINLYFAIKFINTFKVRYIILLGLMMYVFYWIRFYVPVLTLSVIAFWMLTNWKSNKKFLLIPLALIALFMMLPELGANLGALNPSGLMYGVIRFALTPQPWSVSDEYSFLLIPSYLNWIFFVPALLGGIMMYKKNKQTRLFLYYLLAVFLLYSVFPAEQGPRHRLQVIFIFAWMQFHFIWAILRGASTLATSKVTKSTALTR